MNFEEFSKNLYEYCLKINIKLSETQLKQFYKYMKIMLEWNQKINLTNIIEPEEIIIKHFIDSLTAIKYINEEDSIIDIGTGAGFPGIPIKIAYPNCKITLLDSLNKRIMFLDEVIKELSLVNINTIHSRAEDAGQNKLYREKYDIAISRAVAPLNVLLEYLIPFVKTNGKCICMKGPKIEDELKNSQNAFKILNSEMDELNSFSLPETDITRTITIIRKKKETDKKYPRKAGVPYKQPL